MRNKKPEIQTLQYLDWFSVERYLSEKYKDKKVIEACQEVLALAEVRNDSYNYIPTDIEDYYFEENEYYKDSITLFCELFNKEYPDLKDIVFWVSW